MKHKGFVVLLGTLLALVIVSAPFEQSVQAAGGYDAVVEATGDDTASCERSDLPGVFVTQDVCNIQAAVNNNPGGKILLKGTFYFAEYGTDGSEVPGTDGTVFITNDIEIYGEKDGKKYSTVILGGYNTFSVGYLPVEWGFDFFDESESDPENAVPVSATIQNIEFRNSLYSYIRIWASTGATIKGNKIMDGRSLSVVEWSGQPEIHGTGFGIVGFPPGIFYTGNPQLLTGDILVTDNYLDGMIRRAETDDPWGAATYGIPVRGLAQFGIAFVGYDANVTISDNEVYNMGYAGINIGGKFGDTLVKGNYVSMVPMEDDFRPWYDGVEIWGNYFSDGTGNGNIEFAENDVLVSGANYCQVLGVNINLLGSGTIVRENNIRVEQDMSLAIGFAFDDISNATISENDVSGNGIWGIAIWPYITSDGNIVKENDVKHFVPADAFGLTGAHYYLGYGATNNTLYVDKKASVLDESGNDSNVVYYGD